jgi:ABC-type uncharacterized transport system substrate-binding protein
MTAAATIRWMMASVWLAAVLVCTPIKANQPAALPRIGLLMPVGENLEEELRRSLRDLGYIDRKTVAIELREADGTHEELRSKAEDLVRSNAELIVTWGIPATRAVLDATQTVPIVFCVADPVATGMVESLAKPGGNATGVALLVPGLTAKRLELIRQLVPHAHRIAYLRNPSNPVADRQFAVARQAARTMGVELVALDARDTREVQMALEALSPKGLDALLVSGERLFRKERGLIARVVRRAKLPTIFPWREGVQEGAVMSYAWNPKDAARRIAAYVDRIRKGAKPADLPVEQVSEYQLVINLSIARELGIDVPQSLLLQADEVIR